MVILAGPHFFVAIMPAPYRWLQSNVVVLFVSRFGIKTPSSYFENGHVIIFSGCFCLGGFQMKCWLVSVPAAKCLAAWIWKDAIPGYLVVAQISTILSLRCSCWWFLLSVLLAASYNIVQLWKRCLLVLSLLWWGSFVIVFIFLLFAFACSCESVK